MAEDDFTYYTHAFPERIPGHRRMTAEEIVADLRAQRAASEPAHPAVPVPGEGPVDAVLAWRGQVYAARSGCIWVSAEDGWTLADGENLPPGFPPRKERVEQPED